jgi:nitrite reductase/ring-hydroxylating ferredoxin subunit
MTDGSVRVTVAVGDERRSVRIHDTAGDLTVGDATLRFDVSDGVAGGAADDDGYGGADDAPDPDRHLAPLSEVPTNTTLRFEAVAGRRGVEGIAQRNGEEVVAWENSCPHQPEVRLDRGLGALVDGDRLVCDEHGARFDRENGLCTRGPCRGQSLRPIDVEVREGEVYVTDERFEACRVAGL